MAWFKNLRVGGKLLISFIAVIIVAFGAGAFALVNMKVINDSYSSAMHHTAERIGYIFEAKDHLANLRMVSREVYYPTNTKEDIEHLHDATNIEFDRLAEVLNNLYKVEGPEVQEIITSVLPTIETYRKDVEEVFKRLLNAGKISPDNPDYRTAQLRAEQMTINISNTYGDDMAAAINNLSDIALTAAKDLAAENDAQANLALFITIMVFIAMTIFGLLIALFISGLISKPLTVLASFMKKAGTTGDIMLRPEDIENINKVARLKDEIGQTVGGSMSFLEHVTRISEELKTVAGGDLTGEIKVLSEKDTMGQSLKYMIESLNNMFIEFQASTSQASTGSRQVAQSAQALAQNSAEQAAAVEALSSSITEIKQNTQSNFKTAEEASKFSGTIKKSAEKGALQMNELTSAVKEINSASQSIGRIITAIDDLAFQTNILALNAAVEAARAGQHGKGFAVVAEEVRNLATKSAGAANETSVLIQNTIKKAELGAHIAADTAASFAEIVEGINENNKLIALITAASEEQLKGISHINTGIEQVSRSVQQNSATAEESAAASEEMSSQAVTLQESIAHFKLKEE